MWKNNSFLRVVFRSSLRFVIAASNESESPADLGGGRGDFWTPFSRDSTPCRPKGSTLCIILRYFCRIDPTNFLRAPVAPIYTNFEAGARPKKRDFSVKIVQKLPKSPF